MRHQDILAILTTAPITQGLETSDLEALIAHSQIVNRPSGTTIIAEGQTGDALHILLSGQLDVSLLKANRGRNDNRFSDIHLNTLRPGDCFGEYSLIDAQPASASVIVSEAAEILVITRHAFQTLIASQDRLGKIMYYNLLRILIRRLRKKDKELDLNLDLSE